MFPGIEPVSTLLLMLSLVIFDREEKSNSSRLPLRLQLGKLSSTMLPAKLQVTPNHWQWFVEFVRFHEFRESGLFKLDFQFSKASASVFAWHFKDKDEMNINMKMKSWIWNWIEVMFGWLEMKGMDHGMEVDAN